MKMSGGPFGREDLDELLSKVRDAWKNFNPLSRRHEDYVAQLNSLLGGTMAGSIESVRPLLVSIDRLDDRSYAVLTIRQTAISVAGEPVRSVKVTGTAMVLQGTSLVRLEMIREMRTPSDVDEVRAQIVAWSRTVIADTASPKS